MRRVFVSHPRTQHSQQLALALHEISLLQAFWSGVPVLCDGDTPPFWLPKYYAQRIKKVNIPTSLRKHPLFFQAISRIGDFIPNRFLGEDYNYKVFHLFDWWVSLHISRLKPKVVIAYEDSAYHTFRAAKAIGARCILDAPSLHHVAGTQLLGDNPKDYFAKINHRRDEEILLADMILTCSSLAAQSYLDAGVPSEKVNPVLLGATLPQIDIKWQSHTKPLHFIFAGVLSQRKAIDVILATFRQLHADALPYRLSFIGGEGEPGWIQQIKQTPNAEYYHGVAQTELFQKITQADCLLLPSRFDSFGMVVAEALACGTPVVVSTQTGSKAIIEQFPKAGWIVECDEKSLYSCIKERIQNREALFTARKYATEASQYFTWSAYRLRVGELIQHWMEKNVL